MLRFDPNALESDNMKKHKNIYQWMIYIVSFFVLSVAYNNCGSLSGENGGSAGSSVAPSNNGDIIAIPNTKTASILRASRTLDSLVSCMSLVKPSPAAVAEFNKVKSSISEEGLANSLTQPMVKSMVSVSAVVCNDLINKERALAPAERLIFKTIDFTNPGLNKSQIHDTAKRLARSCWGRNPEVEELDEISVDIGRNFSGDTNQIQTNKLVYMCTAMASSFSTYEM